MKIGFIGTGNMATAIIKGIVAKEFAAARDIYLYDILTDKVHGLADEVGATRCSSNTTLIEAVDVVVLAVKPNLIEQVLLETKSVILTKKPLLISIAAGTPTDKLYHFLQTDQEIPIVRVMPNVNALIGKGAAAVCGHDFATEQQIDYVLKMFQSVGSAWRLTEQDFSNFTALAGSSPAFAYLFIDSIARAGVKHGLPKELANEIAAQAVLGSAQMVLESDESPWALIDQVSSPGGTTIAGLLALEEEAFMSTVVKGIDTVIAKDQAMNEE
ncbi:pyrroline-5-carboxylate reductase [Amphibacillus sp. Q70]|uniref:pyrroline-5-carboxylate reductase n=1 Tax=Amphibacillus sp. Q70 TaxID=3453416 RepID=UPI003F85A7F7